MSNRGMHVTRMGWMVLSMAGVLVALVWWVARGGAPAMEQASLSSGHYRADLAPEVQQKTTALEKQDVFLNKEEPVPVDVSEREWKSVVNQMAGWPNRDAEVKRMGAYLTFYNRAQKWADLQSKPDSDIVERRRLAQQVLDDIPGRVAQAEMTSMEAKDLTDRLLADTTQEGQEREWGRERMAEKIKNASGDNNAVLTSRQLSQIEFFKQRETEIRARWAGVPEEQRRQDDLDAQLRGLAVEVFGSL